jgi:MoaA/NifB/PqqE/SkfB family radical SAM enzyme
VASPLLENVLVSIIGDTMPFGHTARAKRIDLYITNRCNLTCPTCFLGDEYFQGRTEMSLPYIREIVQWAARNCIEDISFLGGEPTLHPDFSEIVQLPNAFGIVSTRVTTNGNRRFQSLLRDPVASLLSFVYISIDGACKETHDSIRGNGSFNDCLESMRLLSAANIPFGITFTITRRSIDEIDQMIELAEQFGCSTLNVHWLSNTGRAVGRTDSIPAAQWLDVCNRLTEFSGDRPDFSIHAQPAFVSERIEFAWAKGVDPYACAVRELDNLQFMPDGSVFVCGLLADNSRASAFIWDGNDLLVRKGETEFSLCTSFTAPGCPIRQLASKGGEEHPGLIPICIYERVFSKKSNQQEHTG